MVASYWSRIIILTMVICSLLIISGSVGANDLAEEAQTLLSLKVLLMLALTHIGYFAHVLTEVLKLIEAKPECKITLTWVMVNRRYRMSLAYLGAIAGFSVLYYIQDLSPLTAIGVGYLSADTFTEIGRATSKRIHK